jgi:hypothetical protein
VSFRVVAIVILILLIVSACGGTNPPTATPISTATVAPAIPTLPPATATPAPATATLPPAATATEPPPTATLPPATATPEAPPSPTASAGGLSKDEQAYVQNALAWASTYNKAIADLDFLDTHRRIDADEWDAELFGDVTAIDAINGAVQDYVAPAKFAAAHKLWQEAATHFATLVDLLQGPVKESDDQFAPEVGNEALAGTQLYLQAMDQLKPYMQP